LGYLSVEKLFSLRKAAIIASTGSSTRIEGAKLSDKEVDILLSNINIKSFKSRDEEEVSGYAEAMNTILESYKEIPLFENYIKQLHGILLKFSARDQYHKGEYKKTPNHVEIFDENGKSLGIVFETAPPFETPGLMKDLITGVNQMFKQKKYHPLLIISYFNIHFLAIHPFQDGNGRLSRILTNLLLLQNGYQYIQYSSLEHIIENNKDKYYLALRKSQKNIRARDEDVSNWHIFFLQCLKEQKDILLSKIENERKMEILPEISERIINLIKEQGRITNRQIVSIIGLNRNTVKINLKKLIESNYLQKHGQGKGTYYTTIKDS